MALGYDLLDFVTCWVPLGAGVEVAPTGCQRERGAAGALDGWAVRRRGRYGVVWVSGRTLTGTGTAGARVSDLQDDPVMDRAAVLEVVRWGTRTQAIRDLQG